MHQLKSVDLEQLQFVGDALSCLRQEVDGQVDTLTIIVVHLQALAIAGCS